jgi:hypothetical protein
MNKISQTAVALTLASAVTMSGCAFTNTAMVATVTASDIKYVIDKYPETTKKITELNLSEDQRKRLEDTLKSLDMSYNYFKDITPANVDVNQLVTEYVATRSAYLDLKDIVSSTDIEDARLQSELQRMDTLVVGIDQNIKTVLEEGSGQGVDPKTIQTLTRTLSTLIKLAM